MSVGFICLVFVLENMCTLGQEPHCNKFSFEEQLLEKMIRLEVKVESMFERMSRAQLDITELSTKVTKELARMAQERDVMKKEASAHKAEIREILEDADRQMGMNVADFESKITRFSEDIMDLNNTVAFTRDQSVTYTRWGRTSCPNVSTILYEGYAAGSHQTHSGGPSNTICLPKDPQHGNVYSGQQSSYIYASEYEESDRSKAIFGHSMGSQDVPCVVCEATTRTAMLMIPARKECYKGWQLEYTGYLMTSKHSHHRANMKCVDIQPEAVPGSGADTDGDLFYFVEAAGAISDPPYTRGVELTCVVCTK